ncbi:hypothetical protein [Shewanella colwelliana]|uniref:hypothetical protein n=1 Tax=Shewanella colwelliana TaxID=23 RepID=UPI00299D7327|nr:hypothetical protein [Shewanella colwelliana]MDX1281130.1 hypothetical protein [Shewanella colwelliana]
MLSLSIADQYHLAINVELAATNKNARVKVHYFYPAPLADHSDFFSPSHFYQSLLQKQSLIKATPMNVDSVKRDLLILRQTAYAKATHNSNNYIRALSNFVSGINQMLLTASTSQLALVGELIESFQGIHDNENQLTHHKRFQLANHQLLYHFHQTLLQHKLKACKSEKSDIESKIIHTCNYANKHHIKLTDSSEDGQEKLLRRLHMGRRIINSPYKVRCKKLNDGAVVEQLIFGFAAALAMAFATGVAFATQKAFGNFSTPFFVSLVLSYIFKDRIKELGRNYLMQKFFSHFFQHHYRFYTNDDNSLCDLKETYYSQNRHLLNEEVKAIIKRANNTESSRFNTAFVHQRSYHFTTTNNTESEEKFLDELTINLSRPLRKLPKVMSQHWYENESNIKYTNIHKVNTVHLIVTLQHGAQETHDHYKLFVSRKGIHRIDKVDIKHSIKC